MRMGMQPSHIDTHMGAIAALTLMPVLNPRGVTLPPPTTGSAHGRSALASAGHGCSHR
jgi:hypothetical protein